MLGKSLLPALFLDVTNVVSAHSRSAHVADEGKQLIFLREGKRGVISQRKASYPETPPAKALSRKASLKEALLGR